jgi:uncharacterized protein (TIGR03435 family)
MKTADKPGNMNMNGGLAGSAMTGKGMTMSRLADILSGVAKRPVVDATGLSGAYDLELKYSTEMHLNSRKVKAPVWVVVRAEKPSEN